MKIQNKLSFLIYGLFLLSSCNRQSNPLTYTKNQLIFGSGGGFANQVNEYRLLDSRYLYSRRNNDSTFKELGKQKSGTVKKLFKESEAFFKEAQEFNQPGNMYYYIRLQKGYQTQSLVWGRPDTKAPEKATGLYRHLMNLVPSN